MGNTASNSWPTNFKKLKEIHDEAYHNIDQAIRLEEQLRPNDAVEKYKQSILVIDKALNVVVSCPDNPDHTWKEACEMVSKMKRTRAEVLMRINSITSSPDFEFIEMPVNDATVSNSSAPNSSASGTITYEQLATALNNLHGDSPRGSALVIYEQEDVQLYFISPDGEVNSTLEPQTLRILQFEESSTAATKHFLEVGNWFYLLVGGVSPCLCTDFDAFILPDVNSDVKGSSVGIIVPKEAQKEFLEVLEDILHGIAQQGATGIGSIADIAQVPGSRIASGLVTGAGYIARGLVFGAQKVGDFMNYSTPKLIETLPPGQRSARVPVKVTKGFKIAQNTTSKAAEVTGVVAEKVGTATAKLGQFLAPHIRNHGSRLLVSRFNYSQDEANSSIDNVLSVTAGAVEGFATIYTGLDTSAGILLKSLRENSVKVVQHKYGESAGGLVNDTLGTVENVINIRGQARILTPKGLAKCAAKQTALAAQSSFGAATSQSLVGEKTSLADASGAKLENQETIEGGSDEVMNEIGEEGDKKRDKVLKGKEEE